MSESAARDRVELVSWVLLAAATVGSAWCAYEATLWSGEQTKYLARSTVAQFASSRKTTIANRNQTIDVTTYLQFVAADLHGDAKVTSFLRQNARPEFKPALEAWIADKATGRAAVIPFARPEYHVGAESEATALDAKAARDVSLANAANQANDVYVLHTVLFALALFFLGATSQTRGGAVRKVMLAFGALSFVLTVISMSRLPRAATTLPHELEQPPGGTSE